MPESKTIAAMLKKFNFGCFIGIEKIIDQSLQSGILTGLKTLSEFDAGK